MPPLRSSGKYSRPRCARADRHGHRRDPGRGRERRVVLLLRRRRDGAREEERKKWGKGSYEAIVCSEVANNANVGGSMLPTLTLGIPGNAAAAAILAALELKNVVVGPRSDRESRADLSSSISG